MKTSNIILLATLLLAIGIMGGIQAALHVKYKRGEIISDKQVVVQNYIGKTMPRPAALQLSGVEVVNLIPSDTFRIEYIQPHPLTAFGDASDEFDAISKDSAGAVIQPTITTTGDTIKINCPYVDKRISKIRIFGLSDGKTPISITHGVVTAYGSAEGKGPDYLLNLENLTFFAGQESNDGTSSGHYNIHNLTIDGFGLGFNISDRVHIEKLNIRMAGSTLLSILNEKQIDSAHVSLDSEANVQLSGAMLKRTTFEH